MLKKSFAAANLCSWVLNIYKFNRIYVKVKPLMDSLEAARATKAAAEKKLEGVQALVAEVQSRLADLRSTLLEATEEKELVYNAIQRTYLGSGPSTGHRQSRRRCAGVRAICNMDLLWGGKRIIPAKFAFEGLPATFLVKDTYLLRMHGSSH